MEQEFTSVQAGRLKGRAVPVVAEEFGGVGSANGAVAAAEIVGGAILVASPADALGILGAEGDFGRSGLSLDGSVRRAFCGD